MRNPAGAAAEPKGKRRGAGKKKGEEEECKDGVKRGPWKPEEDAVLASFVGREGEGRWRTLPRRAGLQRCGKSCRLRWMNYLRPSIKRGPISPDEEDLILRLHRLLGNRWSLIAGRIPGRTDNEIKNYWNTHLSKKLISQGIDPRTHKPLSPYPSPPSSSHPNICAAAAAAASTTTTNNNNPPFSQALFTLCTPYFNPNPNTAPAIRREARHCDYFGSVQIDLHDEGLLATGEFGPASNEDCGMDCFADDAFGSFLNSLINDEPFLPQQQLHQQDMISYETSEKIDGCDEDGKNKYTDKIAATEPGFSFSNLLEEDDDQG